MPTEEHRSSEDFYWYSRLRQYLGTQKSELKGCRVQGGREDADLGWDLDLDWDWVYGTRKEKVRARHDARSRANFPCFMAHSSVPWTPQACPCLQGEAQVLSYQRPSMVSLVPLLLMAVVSWTGYRRWFEWTEYTSSSEFSTTGVWVNETDVHIYMSSRESPRLLAISCSSASTDASVVSQTP